MDASEIANAFDEVFDQALVFHAYTDYMRDYELVIQASADPSTGIPTEYLRYVFTDCVRADVTTALSEEIWSRSLDDRLIDYETGVDLDGYVWGVKWQELCGGLSLVQDSPEAHHWAAALGIPFHEARVETNGHLLRLIFSDLKVSTAEPGYSPFRIGAPFWDGKIPL